MQGKPIDRVPFLPFILGFCARNVGIPLARTYDDPRQSFWAQMRTREQYGYDGHPFYGYASYGCWEFGGEVRYPAGRYEQAPSHGRHPVETEDDVDDLALPDVRTAGMLPSALRFSRLQQEHGMPVSVVVGGPFTIAGNICAVETLSRWLIKKPALAHHLLRLATDHLLQIAEFWLSSFPGERVTAQVWEPSASNQIISPKQFEEFVLPYQRELHERMLALGIEHILCHICGEQKLNLPLWAEVPMGDPGVVSIGSQTDLGRAIEYFGDTSVIAGNIDPVIIQTGTHEEVYELCREAIEAAKHAPRGYILMAGCEVPVMTPPYNLYTMMRAVDDLGRYVPAS
jgi:uroporphyrinogen decarboxylase